MNDIKYRFGSRRAVVAMAMVLALFSLDVSVSAKDRTLSNGFSLQFVLGSPSSSYGNPDNDFNNLDYGMLYGLQIGNRWYFNPAETWGIGLMINWFDFSSSQTQSDIYSLDASLIELGPIGTYAINEDMAIDGYYNLRPTYLMVLDADDVIGVFAGFGFTHALGVAYRWKVLSVGVETVFGSVNSVYADEDSILDGAEFKLKNNSTRFVLGFKF